MLCKQGWRVAVKTHALPSGRGWALAATGKEAWELVDQCLQESVKAYLFFTLAFLLNWPTYVGFVTVISLRSLSLSSHPYLSPFTPRPWNIFIHWALWIIPSSLFALSLSWKANHLFWLLLAWTTRTLRNLCNFLRTQTSERALEKPRCSSL